MDDIFQVQILIAPEGTNLSVMLDLRSSANLDTKQIEVATRNLFNQLETIGLTVEREPDPTPKLGAKAGEAFLPGILKVVVGALDVRKLVDFLVNRLIREKQTRLMLSVKSDGSQDITIEANSREDLQKIFDDVQKHLKSRGVE